MRLGTKTRTFLDILGLLAEDTLKALLTRPSLYRYFNFSNDNSFQARLQKIKERDLAAPFDPDDRKWVFKLTEKGKTALDGRLAPENHWHSKWDGQWRLFTFDLPQHSTAQRSALRRWLKERRFGKLQGSVWISPHPHDDWLSDFAKMKIDPSYAVFMTGTFPKAIEEKEYIKKTWNLLELKEAYSEYIAFLEANSSAKLSPEAFQDWRTKEHLLWTYAVRNDPLLPKDLWPTETNLYLGPKAHEYRKQAYQTWAESIVSQL